MAVALKWCSFDNDLQIISKSLIYNENNCILAHKKIITDEVENENWPLNTGKLIQWDKPLVTATYMSKGTTYMS